MTTVRDRWTDYSVGINELGQTDATFTKREWDLGSERFIGMKFSDLVPILLRESRFNLACFTPSKWIGNYQGGIVEAYFKIYKVNPHERSGQQRKTGGGQIDRWVSVPVDPRGKIYPGYNPLEDELIAKESMILGFVSRVGLNNLSDPGSNAGYAHFPILDIVHKPTPENVEFLIKEVKRRTLLQKFFVLRSSDRGLMVIGPELMDEDNFIACLLDSLLLNHVEVEGEYWVDDRWVARSTQNLVKETEHRVNPYRVGGILRMIALPPDKPEEPTVIAASF
ncbi:hypothetical protein A2361_01640 [Candidatus Woesebacteria bacterium RIFOXYB1_FULL_40_26]|uniref:Uncharacterized protein n=1 Tax=Candidatus Woesebacteria bacterium RIFOXYB1_FULL_40_26 TaxID=1802539 RepID=A0A1F8CY93_9BACT|nr:MAG: hypothetical protein A2361_01640 [Candidatus Woesebacteria bacterium RIFOXYB1_FULL_40_26]